MTRPTKLDSEATLLTGTTNPVPNPIPNLVDNCKVSRPKFLQRVSIACYAERCTSYLSVRLSVCLSVHLSHAGAVSK